MTHDGIAARFRLQLLGVWRLSRGQVPLQVGMRQQRLITALAIRGVCERGYLTGLLWPDATECQAKSSLRVAVHLISRQIPELLVREGTHLSLSESVDIDLHRLRAVLNRISCCDLDGMTTNYLAALQKGDLLPGWYEDFVLVEQARLHLDLVRSYRRIATEALGHGSLSLAIQAARAALEIEPQDDYATGQLIRAELLQGNHAGAVRVYAEHAETLKRELGVLPAPQVTALIATLRRSSPEAFVPLQVPVTPE